MENERIRRDNLLDGLIDRFCFGLVSLVAGIRIVLPASDPEEDAIYQAQRAGDRILEAGAPVGVRGFDSGDESRRAYTARRHGRWADMGYFIGDFDVYKRLADAFRAKGLGYVGDYYSTAGDCERARFASQEAAGVSGISARNIT